MNTSIAFLLHVPLVLVLGWLAYRRIVKKAPLPRFALVLSRFIRFVAVIALFGLAGCASTEALPIAQGPLFALNPTHWHATAKDLEAPPPVVNP
ncbi:MAG: hypothetical protein M0T84_05015 [Betaproteobacteria bacterium]|nr:hypothetical protein [Betaproteobacteria bacterium]